MDNVTDTLVGVALYRAGFARLVPRALWLLLLGANLADIDVLALLRGQLAEFEMHRGYTHTLLAIPLLALLCVGLTTLITRQRLPFIRAWLTAGAGVAAHLLLDWTGSFGIRPLLPFSSKWFYLDLNGSYDGVILAVLGLALLWPWFASLVSGEIGAKPLHRGRGSSIAALLFLVCFEGARWTLHRRALNDLNTRLYDDQVPVEVSALPEPNNPFHWTGVVETQDAYEIVSTGTFDLAGASDARIFRKPPVNAAYLAAMRCEAFRYMAYFSRFPAWGAEPVKLNPGIGQLLDLTDLRFGAPGEGEFHASALLDARGRVLDCNFSFGTDQLQAIRQGAWH
jgi:inner membrane protein